MEEEEEGVTAIRANRTGSTTSVQKEKAGPENKRKSQVAKPTEAHRSGGRTQNSSRGHVNRSAGTRQRWGERWCVAGGAGAEVGYWLSTSVEVSHKARSGGMCQEQGLVTTIKPGLDGNQ